MPNWVDNAITINGEPERLEAIQAILTADSEFQKREREHYNKEDGATQRVFSLSNLVCPPKEIWEDYFTTADGKEPTNNWYSWNIYHWGTKWDAVEPDVDLDGDTLTIRFQTAWDCVGVEVLDALADILCSNNALWCTYWYEEEQGWGGERIWDNHEDTRGYFRLLEEWGIPESHADYKYRDKDCPCEWSTVQVFDDCPEVEEE